MHQPANTHELWLQVANWAATALLLIGFGAVALLSVTGTDEALRLNRDWTALMWLEAATGVLCLTVGMGCAFWASRKLWHAISRRSQYRTRDSR